MTAAEAENPRRNLPKAVRRIYIRILVLYIGGVFVIGLLVPSNNPLLNINSENASAAPFVIAINQAGIKGLPSVSCYSIPLYILAEVFEIINAAVLSSAWSGASSDLYIASRGLCIIHPLYVCRYCTEPGFIQTVLLLLAVLPKSSCGHPGPGCLMSLWLFVPVFHFWPTWL